VTVEELLLEFENELDSVLISAISVDIPVCGIGVPPHVASPIGGFTVVADYVRTKSMDMQESVTELTSFSPYASSPFNLTTTTPIFPAHLNGCISTDCMFPVAG
jgi:hypothetical protein